MTIQPDCAAYLYIDALADLPNGAVLHGCPHPTPVITAPSTVFAACGSNETMPTPVGFALDGSQSTDFSGRQVRQTCRSPRGMLAGVEDLQRAWVSPSISVWSGKASFFSEVWAGLTPQEGEQRLLALQRVVIKPHGMCCLVA